MMESAVYKFVFDHSVSMEEAEATLHLAVLAAESLHGESTVRMDAAYSIDEEHRICVIDGNNEVGRCICRIFTGYLTREFGADAFRVRPAGAPPAVAVPA